MWSRQMGRGKGREWGKVRALGGSEPVAAARDVLEQSHAQLHTFKFTHTHPLTHRSHTHTHVCAPGCMHPNSHMHRHSPPHIFVYLSWKGLLVFGLPLETPIVSKGEGSKQAGECLLEPREGGSQVHAPYRRLPSPPGAAGSLSRDGPCTGPLDSTPGAGAGVRRGRAQLWETLEEG